MFGSNQLRWLGWCVMAVMICITGCGGSGKPPVVTGKAAGSVTHNGSPVGEGRVQLVSSDTGVAVIAVLDSAGKFEMKDPVPVGQYKAIILPPQEAAPEAGVEYKPKDYPNIPLNYRDEFNSDLTATIKEGENNLTFDMKS